MSWAAHDNQVWHADSEDVAVSFEESENGKPFVGRVAGAKGSFATLAEAMDWCDEVVRGRGILAGRDPLYLSDDGFLEERGLTP